MELSINSNLGLFISNCKKEQQLKAALPMLVTDEGITNSRNDPQFPKTQLPILVTDEGITNSRNASQL